jgi:hypothetical protein
VRFDTNGPFSVEWHRQVRSTLRGGHRWELEATLTERVLYGGKPVLKAICRIGAINEDAVADVAAADRFWAHASRRLGKLSRLHVADIAALERMIAQRVPRPRRQDAAE